ncbi:unnamed protein product [Rotaria socialis]
MIVLRTLTSAVHGTRRHALEVQTNLKLLRLSAVYINQKTFNCRLGCFIKKIQPHIQNNQLFSSQKSLQLKKIVNDNDEIENIRSIFGDAVKLYKTIIHNDRRFTIVTCQTSGNRNDSCILYKIAKKTRVGFITSIIETSSNEKSCVLQVRDVPINRYLTINVNGTKIICSNVMFSKAEQTHSYFFVTLNDIVEKLVHVFDNPSKTFILIRFPNMMESS